MSKGEMFTHQIKAMRLAAPMTAGYLAKVQEGPSPQKNRRPGKHVPALAF